VVSLLKVLTLEHILRFFPATILLVFLALAANAQTAPPSIGIADIYLAKDNGSGHAGDAAKTFLPTDIPIYCVVQLDSTAGATVRMNLVAESVPGVKAETKVVSTSYTTKNGEDRVNFFGKPYGNWVPGKYRADIFVNDVQVTNLTFEIVAPVKAVATARAPVARKPNRRLPISKKKPIVPVTAQVVDR
jgi:hypothetical protein